MNTIRTLLSVITLVNVCFFIYLIALVYRKKSSKSHNRFILVLIFSLLWIIDSYLQGFDTAFYVFLTYLNFALAGFVAVSIASFSIHFPTQNSRLSQKKEIVFFLPIVLISFLSFFGAWVKPFYFKGATYTPYYFIYFCIIIIYFIVIPLINFVHKRKHAKGILLKQINYFLFGYLISIIILLSESFYVNVLHDISVNMDVLILNSSLFFILFAFYSTIKYRFLDLGLIIKKHAVRLVSFALIFGIYLFIVLSLKDSINLKTQSEQTTFLVVATLIVVVTIEPIRKLVFKVVDKAFESRDKKHEEAQKKVYFTLKSQQKYQELISAISGIIKELYEVENVEFLPQEGGFLQKRKETYHYFKSTGRVLIPEELPYRFDEAEIYFRLHKELEGAEYSAYVSIGQEDLFVGCFAIGKRKNNKAYTVEEVRELKKFQEQFTEAMLNARLYQQAIQRIKI